LIEDEGKGTRTKVGRRGPEGRPETGISWIFYEGVANRENGAGGGTEGKKIEKTSREGGNRP